MKVKNLLLAGLAVAAMTACSNNDEFVDNSVQPAGEEASMKISLKFANEITSRASSGNTDKGEEVEYKSTTVTAIIAYPNSTKNKVYKNLSLKTAGTQTYTTDAFSVEAADNVKVYAIVNYDEDAAKALDAVSFDTKELTVGAQSLPASGLAYINETVAKSEAFLMSGQTEGTIKIIAGNTNNVAPITVNRVAAKLDHMTAMPTKFTVDNKNIIYYDKNNNALDIAVELKGFSYSNLSSNSYVFGGQKSNFDLLQEYVPAGKKATDVTYRWISDKTTYCLENNTIDNPTRVHYKGQVYIGNEAISNDFFIRAVKMDNETTYRLFTSWNDLTAYYNNDAISKLEPTDTEALANYGIMKYTAGICYYEADIKTYKPEESISVLRNNWYQLTVQSITKIGLPTPAQEPTPEETMLTIETTVNPWTIQVNGFDL